MDNTPKEIEIGNGRFRIENGILEISFLPGTELTIDDIKAQSAKVAEMTGGKKILTLSDATNVKGMTREARVFVTSGGGGGYAKALATIVTTPLGRILSNFFMKINKPSFPMKICSTKEEGIAWLQQFKD